MAAADLARLSESISTGNRGHRIDLRRFVTDLVITAGGIVEEPGDALVHVALPADTAGRFGLPEFAALAFDYDVARETPGAEL